MANLPRVMKAGKFDPAKARFPYLASPKLDGIRATVRGGIVMSYGLEPIPNQFIQGRFGLRRNEGLDGELIVGAATGEGVFNRTTSVVMSFTKPIDDLTFHVFDDVCHPSDPYYRRLERLADRVQGRFEALKLVLHARLNDAQELDIFETGCVEAGYEGIMLRDPQGPHKFGRSTVRENWLLKVKRFEDSEAEVIGWEEEWANQNEKVTNAYGRVKRGSSKAGRVGKGTVGKLHLRDLQTGVDFWAGSGLSAAQRASLWARVMADDNALMGDIWVYKHQPYGVKDKPRLPVLKGPRDKRDM